MAAAPRRPVLELACGTGRVTLPLAAAGAEIVGLDIDPGMLAVAASRRGQTRWPLLVAADMRRFGLACRFGAVIVPYNSIQLLADPRAVSDCLAGLLAQLVPGGVIGLETTDFQPGAIASDVARQPIHTGRFDGRPLTLSGSLTHDLGTRVTRYRRHFAGPDWTFEDVVAIRSYRRDELAGAVVAAGLRPDQWWEDGPRTRVVAHWPG